MSSKLYGYTRQPYSLADSLKALAQSIGDSAATAILYSPRRCELARFSNGQLQGSNGEPADTGNVFEARVFNESVELRWLNDPSGAQQHRAVILTEQDSSESLADWQASQQDVIQTLPQTYLLWGEGTGKSAASGWSELATARIGGFSVPIGNVGKNQRLLLNSVEYIVEADCHGNAVVFDERLIKFEKSEVADG